MPVTRSMVRRSVDTGASRPNSSEPVPRNAAPAPRTEPVLPSRRKRPATDELSPAARRRVFDPRSLSPQMIKREESPPLMITEPTVWELTHSNTVLSQWVPETAHVQMDLTGDAVQERDRKSTRLNSSHAIPSRMPSSA